MSLADRIAPASVRRAFFLLLLPALPGIAGQPPPAPPELAQVGLPDAKEAARILEQFRQAGIPGEYYLEFELQAMPRRGETRVYQGRLWGGRNEQGAVMRVELGEAPGRTQRFLIQNGEHAAVWRLQGGKVTQLAAAALFTPLIPGIDITVFDLQMPYLYWPGAKVQAIKRVLGRPANAFLFPAPPAIARQGGVGAVRAYLDTQYNAMTRTEVLGTNGKIQKTFSLVTLQTVDGQTLPKAMDFRNDVTRDKTRMRLTAAALRLDLGPAPFSPEALDEDIRPPRGRLIRLD